MTRPYSLHIDTGVREHHAETHLVVGGADLLVHEQTKRFRGDPWLYRPADPVGLLPPDSRVLLPAADPVPAMVGICTCGEPGCDSLWMQIRRDGEFAVWEPLPDAPRASIRGTYRFPLVPYLDAIDDGVRRVREDPRRLLARELRARRDSRFGPPILGELVDVRAWPGVDTITIGVRARTDYHRIPVDDDDTADAVLGRLRESMADRRGIVGHVPDRSADPPLTPRAETILRMARAEAVARGHRDTGVEHLMLAVLAEGRSVPALSLAGRIPLDEVRAALEEDMSRAGYSRG